MPAPRHRSIAAALVLAAAAAAGGCSDGPAARSIKVTPGRTYQAPLGNFTVVVPPLLSPGMVATESAAPDGSADGVRVSDDFGTLLAVRAERLPVAGGLPVEFASQVSPAALDRYVDARVVPRLGGPVTRRQRVRTAAGEAVFLVAPASAVDGGRPGLSVGIAVFPQLRWAYTVTVQQVPPTPTTPPLAPVDRDTRLLSDLRQTIARTAFE